MRFALSYVYILLERDNLIVLVEILIYYVNDNQYTVDKFNSVSYTNAVDSEALNGD